MVAALANPPMRYADYVAFAREAREKHEFWDGRVYAMAGGSEAHALISANLIRSLGNQLRASTCRVYSSDLRIRAKGTDNGAYPDLSVVCGPSQKSEDDNEAVENPKVIVEVLSNSTEAFDRGNKFAFYRKIASMDAYVLVSQRERRLEVYERNRENEAWTLRTVDEGDLSIACISVRLSVDEVYENVVLTA
jgi:Uma2 family endonuclease